VTEPRMETKEACIQSIE